MKRIYTIDVSNYRSKRKILSFFDPSIALKEIYQHGKNIGSLNDENLIQNYCNENGLKLTIQNIEDNSEIKIALKKCIDSIEMGEKCNTPYIIYTQNFTQEFVDYLKEQLKQYKENLNA